MDFDVDSIRLTPESQATIERAQAEKKNPTKFRKGKSPGEFFIRGPIPFWWISKAATLRGKSLHLALALWSVHHCSKGRIILTYELMRRFNLQRVTAHRALKYLVEAELARVEKSTGRLAIVRLQLDRPAPAEVSA